MHMHTFYRIIHSIYKIRARIHVLHDRARLVYMFFMTGLGWFVLNLFKMTLPAEKETMTSAINVDRVAPSARTALTFYS